MKTERSVTRRTGRSAATRATLAAALTAALATAGCLDDPLAPKADPAMETPALRATFLIGGSPLVPVTATALKTRQAPDGSVDRALEVGFEVTLPVTVDGGAGYLLRTSAAFYANIDPRDDPVATVDPRDDPVALVDPKGDPVALVVIALPIDDGGWTAIEKSTPKAGDKVDAVVTAELIQVARDGSETVLDRVTTSGAIDPRDDPAA